jgi:hypothetical protein
VLTLMMGAFFKVDFCCEDFHGNECFETGLRGPSLRNIFFTRASLLQWSRLVRKTNHLGWLDYRLVVC